MKLTIVSVDHADFGAYKCVAKNSLGETDGSIKLYSEYPFLFFQAYLDTLRDLERIFGMYANIFRDFQDFF